MLDVKKIWSIIPHRYPFLLVDRVLEYKEGVSAKGIKNVSINEPCFQGHFPSDPVFPGVLIIEAMAQLAGICALSKENFENLAPTSIFFVKIENAIFRRKVVPGDSIILYATKIREMLGMHVFETRAEVASELVASARLTAKLGE